MSSTIIASEISCGLGRSIGVCTQVLKAICSKERLPSPGSVHISDLEEPVTLPYFGIESDEPKLPHELMYELTHSNIASVIAQSGFDEHQLSRTGLFWGSSSFTVSDSEQQYWSALQRGEPDPLPMPIVGYNKLPEKLAREFGLSDCVHSYATACTSSANALIYADLFIQSGKIDHAIVVGSEFYNAITLLGFHGLELLSPSKAMRPFNSDRDGLVLGEACAAVLLSNSSAGSMRFLGGAGNTDSFSLTAANIDGSTIAEVMNDALENAGKSVGDVRAIKSHGTASLMNDEAESAGILRVYDGQPVPTLFAIKPYIGHSLGACGISELVLLHASLRAGFVPANPGIAKTDEHLGVSLVDAPSDKTDGVYLLNYFAFGGNNCSLVFQYDS